MAKIDLLRPLWWLEETKAEVGGTLNLSILEMGIEGDAKVLKIGPCTTDSRNRDPKYQVVTGKYTYENAIILDLTFNNDTENNLGVTPNHRFWSTSRNSWIEAEQLKIGESVKTKDGIAQLTSRTQRPGRHTVYNLEVHKSHTYYVANQCILAHNNSCPVKAGITNTSLDLKSGTYARPAGYRKGVRDQVWDNAIDPSTGRVRDPKTGQFMSKEKPWDMGHKPGHEFRKHQKSAAERGIDRQQFLDEHNNPSNYRPELPSSNRSHATEDKNKYFSP